jgi:hypothetical protein
MTENPTVSLGGRDFSVPPMAIAQLREVFPALTKLAVLSDQPDFLIRISKEDFGLLIDTVWIGIAAGSPGFTRQEFEKLPAKPLEFAEALSIIAMQSGMAKPREPNRKAVGEAVAASLPIGTRSSRKSSAQPAGPGTT